MDQVKNQFITGAPTFTAELIRSGVVIDTQTVTAELPTLTIVADARSSTGQVTELLMEVVAGQDDVTYHFQSSPDFMDPWNEYELNVFKGESVRANIPPFGQTFFRIKAILP